MRIALISRVVFLNGRTRGLWLYELAVPIIFGDSGPDNDKVSEPDGRAEA